MTAATPAATVAALVAHLDALERRATYALTRDPVDSRSPGGWGGWWFGHHAHYSKQDPAAVLRQVAAIRAVVEMHGPDRPWCDDGYVEGLTHRQVRESATLNGEPYGEECPTLLALAQMVDGGWEG
jgi:hypothetical protein